MSDDYSLSNFYKLTFCLAYIPTPGWFEGSAPVSDIAVSNSDMSLFRNCKNAKKYDGLIPNDPSY